MGRESLNTLEKEVYTLESRIRLLELILYREIGGTGYELAIAQISNSDKEFYDRIESNIKSFKRIKEKV